MFTLAAQSGFISFSSSADRLPHLVHVSVSYCEFQSIIFSYSPSVFPDDPSFPFDWESLQCSSLIFLYSFIPGEEVSILHLEIQLKFFTFSVFLSYHSGLLHNCTLNVQVFSGNEFFCVWTVLFYFLLLLAFHGFVITHQVELFLFCGVCVWLKATEGQFMLSASPCLLGHTWLCAYICKKLTSFYLSKLTILQVCWHT